MINSNFTTFFTCTGLFQDEGWTVEKASVTSPVSITAKVPALHCLVALVGRRHGFNFVLYNNLTSEEFPFVMNA